MCDGLGVPSRSFVVPVKSSVLIAGDSGRSDGQGRIRFEGCRRTLVLQAEAVVRAIWRLGSYRLRQDLLRRIPIRVTDPIC
jgi:hypothetical protein